MQVCKDLCKQVYRYAGKKECKLTSRYLYMYALLDICKYANEQACKPEPVSMKVFKNA